MGFISRIVKKFFGKEERNEKLFSKNTFASNLKKILFNHRKVDDELLEKMEELLITSDVSVNISQGIIEQLRLRVKSKNIQTPEDVVDELMQTINDFYMEKVESFNLSVRKDNPMNVILVVGTNGSGKTTSIAKLSYYFRERGYKVMVIAGDTFRAGAVAQLKEWSRRLKIEFLAPDFDNQDPSSVIYKGIEEAKKRDINMVICDTAGRSQTKKNLMMELTKIKNVVKKVSGEEPNEILLTIDSTSGQNGLSQAFHFSESCDVTGIILTKLDGLNKGGIILPIAHEFKLPVKFIGFGETYYDISEFSIDSYLYNLIRPLIGDENVLRRFGHG